MSSYQLFIRNRSCHVRGSWGEFTMADYKHSIIGMSFKILRFDAMQCLRLLGPITLLLPLLVAPTAAQRRLPSSPTGQSEIPGERPDEVELRRRMHRQQVKKRSEDMKRDSQRLLELATELKNYVDKAGENILSVDVVRKAEEMEKLARQVKNNMRAQ
jgi:hypothetical protein